jgi:hypothetical protein
MGATSSTEGDPFNQCCVVRSPKSERLTTPRNFSKAEGRPELCGQSCRETCCSRESSTSNFSVRRMHRAATPTYDDNTSAPNSPDQGHKHISFSNRGDRSQSSPILGKMSSLRGEPVLFPGWSEEEQQAIETVLRTIRGISKEDHARRQVRINVFK